MQINESNTNCIGNLHTINTSLMQKPGTTVINLERMKRLVLEWKQCYC